MDKNGSEKNYWRNIDARMQNNNQCVFFVHFAAIYYWLFPLRYLIVKKSPVILGQKFEPISSMFVNFAI